MHIDFRLDLSHGKAKMRSTAKQTMYFKLCCMGYKFYIFSSSEFFWKFFLVFLEGLGWLRAVLWAYMKPSVTLLV